VNDARIDTTVPDPPAVEVRSVSKSFGSTHALDGVSLAVRRGSIHALLGPNGAGKTTLLSICTGLIEQDAGDLWIGASRSAPTSRETKSRIGLVPSGDRSFYLRISGFENLLFFARLHDLPKRDAQRRARARLRDVGLERAGNLPVAQYSHGMQKRLAIARALLADPPLLFVDEATHDLDPAGAALIRELVATAVEAGASVLWTTQRIEEIRGFANDVTVLASGHVAFQGSVAELIARAEVEALLIELRVDGTGAERLLARSVAALSGLATIEPVTPDASSHFRLVLAEGVVFGRAIAALQAADIDVVSSQNERSEVESAFRTLTERGEP
jgi:ABC-2 type transport system ATP-binding protein